MANRKIELALVMAAAGLLLWGMWRAINRGEPAVRGWTTEAMVALVALSAVNLFVRSTAIAFAAVAACAFFLALILLAALLGAPEGDPNRVPAILRALSFFAMIGVASLRQAMSLPPAAGAG
jgi:hypothetical protein